MTPSTPERQPGPAPLPDDSEHDWIKVYCVPELEELAAANHHAFCLLLVIALTSWPGTGFNRYGLKKGQAFLKGHREYGMSEQEYRGAKRLLQKHGFAVFRATNAGTVASLAANRIFDLDPQER